MADQLEPVRINHIYQMLFELARGNVAFRLAACSEVNPLNPVEQLLNEFADLLQESQPDFGISKPYHFFKNLAQLTFILDNSYTIVSFNIGAPEFLHYSGESLLKKDFSEFLDAKSLQTWKFLKRQLNKDPNFHSVTYLIFITADRQLFPSECMVSRLAFTKRIVITAITSTYGETVPHTIINSSDDRTKRVTAAEQLHNYILTHLDEQLPTLHELASMFKAEEHALKRSFRKTYNKSIYNFYHETRLEKSHALILQTDKPLKEISYMCGFSGYLNFYKAFKKHFGYPPSELYRPLL